MIPIFNDQNYMNSIFLLYLNCYINDDNEIQNLNF